VHLLSFDNEYNGLGESDPVARALVTRTYRLVSLSLGL